MLLIFNTLNKNSLKNRIIFCIKVITVFALFNGPLCKYCNSQTLVNVRSVTNSCGASKSIITEGNRYIIQQSIGQSGITGTHKVNNFTLRQGFIQPPIKSSKRFKAENLIAIAYPNPFSTFVKISFKEEIKDKLIVVLYNLQGTAIYFNIYQAAQEIDLHLPSMVSGIYFLKVQSNNKYYITNLIKE